MFDVSLYSRIIGTTIVVIIIIFSSSLAITLLTHAFTLDVRDELSTYHDINICLLISLLVIFLISYKAIQFFSKIYFAFLEDNSKLYGKIVSVFTKFLSIVPTPLMVALLLPIYTFELNNIFEFTIFMILIIIICAVPTASQIAIDGLSDFPKNSYDAARGVGLSKQYALLNVVTVEHSKLFQTSTTVGIIRVVIENWVLLTTSTSLSLKEILNDNSLAKIMESSYSNITDKISLFYLLLLLILTVIGKVWTSVIASAVK